VGFYALPQLKKSKEKSGETKTVKAVSMDKTNIKFKEIKKGDAVLVPVKTNISWCRSQTLMLKAVVIRTTKTQFTAKLCCQDSYTVRAKKDNGGIIGEYGHVRNIGEISKPSGEPLKDQTKEYLELNKCLKIIKTCATDALKTATLCSNLIETGEIVKISSSQAYKLHQSLLASKTIANDMKDKQGDS
jgi:ribosomal protein L14